MSRNPPKTVLTRRIVRKYRSGLNGDHALRMFWLPVKLAKNGMNFVIVWTLPAGETDRDWPEVYRFATIEEARACWKAIEDKLLERGYKIHSTHKTPGW